MKKLLLTLLMMALPAFASFTVPPTPNPVNDYSNVLTTQGKEEVAKILVNLKKETGAQVGILIVDTLDGTPLEEASLAVASKWKLGSKQKDDGALFLLVVKDRKMRLEVGYGLEGILTDAVSRRITESMKFNLKQGDYDAALVNGMGHLASVVKAGKDTITSKPKTAESSLPFGAVLLILLLGGLGVAIVVYVRNNEKERLRKEKEAAERKAFWDNERAKQAQREIDREERYQRSLRQKAQPASHKVKEDDTVTTAAVLTGAALIAQQQEEAARERRRRDDDEAAARRRRDDEESSRRSSDSSSSSSSSSTTDYSSSYSSSSYDGGGGSFGGGGSSDSF